MLSYDKFNKNANETEKDDKQLTWASDNHSDLKTSNSFWYMKVHLIKIHIAKSTSSHVYVLSMHQHLLFKCESFSLRKN